MEALAIRPPKRSAVIEKQRQEVAQLCLVERRPHAEVAKELGIPVRTVRSHVQAVRRQMGNELASDPTARDVLMDTMASIDVRIRAMNTQINQLEDRKNSIVDSLTFEGVDMEDGLGNILPEHAKATVRYTDLIRKLRKELRAEEAHRADILQKFGVLREQIDINKSVVTRDDTAWVEAVAGSINEGSSDARADLSKLVASQLERLARQP